jgi:hypothetical protein
MTSYTFTVPATLHLTVNARHEEDAMEQFVEAVEAFVDALSCRSAPWLDDTPAISVRRPLDVTLEDVSPEERD